MFKEATIAIVTNLFLSGLLFLVTFYCSVAMYAIYWDVREQKDMMNRYSLGEEHHRDARWIQTTMLLYTGSFFLCWIIPFIIGTFLDDVPTVMIVIYVLVGGGTYNLLPRYSVRFFFCFCALCNIF